MTHYSRSNDEDQHNTIRTCLISDNDLNAVGAMNSTGCRVMFTHNVNFNRKITQTCWKIKKSSPSPGIEVSATRCCFSWFYLPELMTIPKGRGGSVSWGGLSRRYTPRKCSVFPKPALCCKTSISSLVFIIGVCRESKYRVKHRCQSWHFGCDRSWQNKSKLLAQQIVHEMPKTPFKEFHLSTSGCCLDGWLPQLSLTQ